MINPSSKKHSVRSYVLNFQAEPALYHRGTRYHWMICSAHNPDELVSWGYAPTQELAETAARRELQDLDAGRTQGGRVTKTSKVSLRHY